MCVEKNCLDALHCATFFMVRTP